MPNYSIVSQSGGFLITDNGDPAHSGTLTVNANVEALAFDPAQDPTSASDGSITASGEALVILQSTSKNVTIDAGATLELFASDTGTVTFAAANTPTLAGMLTLGPQALAAPPATINFAGPGDIIQLPGINATSAIINPAGTTLTVNASNHSPLTFNISGTAGDDFTVSSDGQGGSFLTLEPIPYLWGDVVSPAQPAAGVHLYGAFTQINNGLVAALYGDTASGYSDAGPDAITTNLLTLDPFLLPYESSLQNLPQLGQAIDTSTITDFPRNRQQLLLVNPTATQTEGIGFLVTEDASDNATINKFTFAENSTGLNAASPFTSGPTALSPVETGLIGDQLQIFASSSNGATGGVLNSTFTGTGASYSLAWAQYDSAAQTYTADFQIFNPNGSTASLVETLFSLSNVASFTAAPAWFFRNAGTDSIGNVIYGLVHATPGGANGDVVTFQAYNVNGSVNGSPFSLTPNISVFGSNAVDHIDQEPGSGGHTFVPTNLQFALNNGPNNGSSVAWNDAVTDSQGNFLGDQVEFAVVKNGALVAGSQSVFQIADGNAQSISLTTATIGGVNVEILAYGDDAGTHVVEFDTSGHQLASLFDPSTTLFSRMVSFGDGRIALTYDNTLDAAGTTQYDTHIYDLRTTGLNINDTNSFTGSISGATLTVSSASNGGIAIGDTVAGTGIAPNTTITGFLSGTGSNGTYTLSASPIINGSEAMSFNDGKDKYIAGTQFTDTFTGENNVNNTYDFVGLDNTTHSGVGPTDSFTGGGGTAWNVAIMPDSPSDYSITTTGGVTTLVDTGDSAHAGTINLTGVQEVAFAPTADPSGNFGTLTATGDALYILGPLPGNSESITIDTGSTLALATADAGIVTFAGSAGTLTLTNPTNFTGQISGLNQGDASQILDLTGYDTSTTASTVGGYNSGANTTTLTITDSGHTTLHYTLAGNLSGSSWTVSQDASHSGIDIVDPAAPVLASIAGGGSLDLSAPSNETVTFTGGTGSLVLNDPEGFGGQIVGFTGTAPDAAHSDTVDLIGIDYNSSHFAESYDASSGLLTVTDGTHTASLTFDDFNATLDFASDGNGGTLITDPPAAGPSNTSASTPADAGMKFDDDRIGLDAGQAKNQFDGADGAKPALVSLHSGNDSFVFHHDLGAETGAGSNPHADDHEPGNHPDAQLAQHLAALITPDAHDLAVFELIHNDILAPNGVTPAQIHHSIQAGHLLH